jgi:hypothetical protein
VTSITVFYGIVISMYHNDHGWPHLHARYAGRRAALSLDGELLHGKLPTRVLRLVREWMAEHQHELNEKLGARATAPGP